MDDAKRELLAKVAAGAMSPQEAALELQELESTAQAPSAAVEAPLASGLERVRVTTEMGSVTVIGDSSVREAVADGPHVARREGGLLLISADDNDPGAFTFGSQIRFGLDWRERKLTVRMNPQLPLEAVVQAGSLRVQGVLAPIRAEVQAGSARIEGFASPLDVDCQAGSVKAHGRLTGGRSRISCQAGSVKIELAPESSVAITAQTSLGKVWLPGMPAVSGIGGGKVQATVGDGAGTLDINSEMGSVTVSVAG